MLQNLFDLKIVIRGAGEMATGTAWRLRRSGFYKIVMTEIPKPIAVRRTVCFCEAVYDGTATVEGIQAVRINSPDQAVKLWRDGIIPILVDPESNCKDVFKPDVLIDAILAKKNLGTRIQDASLVIGLGPGFCAGHDVHCVVETNRGHDLGRLILEGEASPNTGTPGEIQGETASRVLRSPVEGVFKSGLSIGVSVKRGQEIGRVNGQQVTAGLDGTLRGLIRPGIYVTKDLKIGDIDPRGNPLYCKSISEKARAIAGAVLEAMLMKFNRPQQNNIFES